MSGGIFLLRGDDDLVPMTAQPYDTEDVLQALLARFPDLLAGDQFAGVAPRRWLLIGREAALASDEDGGGRWSVDHLFVDQDAVPMLVEVERSSDTRIRREVVGRPTSSRVASDSSPSPTRSRASCGGSSSSSTSR
jgi:hypothetical protein